MVLVRFLFAFYHYLCVCLFAVELVVAFVLSIECFELLRRRFTVWEYFSQTFLTIKVFVGDLGTFC